MKEPDFAKGLFLIYLYFMEYNYKIQKHNNQRETLQEKTCITSA